MRQVAWLWAAVLSLGMGLGLPARAAGPVVLVEVKGVIGVAASAFIARGIEQAVARESPLVILRLDTPGGLVSSTRDIIDTILASPVPVAVYVAPSGARAASAGTYLVYAAHVAAMAPATHLGAATPVSLGAPPAAPRPADRPEDKPAPRPADTTERKVVNDATAYLRALAQLRGRNAEFAEKSVREAATLTAGEAKEAGVIDVVAATVSELLAVIDGRTVTVSGGEHTLATREAAVETITPDWRTRVIAIVTDPNVAYLLLILGFYGLLFELWHPGAAVPGVLGAICLLMALAALAVMPVSYAGLALLVLGLGLMVAEAFSPTLGVLGVGGLAAFVVGSLFLFDAKDLGDLDYGVAWPTIAAAAAASALFFFAVLGAAIKSRRRPVITGMEQMLGAPGEVIEWQGESGLIRTHGETWQARLARSGTLTPGDSVRVVRLDGLTAVVEPMR